MKVVMESYDNSKVVLNYVLRATIFPWILGTKLGNIS